MRIVTGYTTTLFYGSVNNGTCILGLMTQVTQGFSLCRQFEIVCWRFCGMSRFASSVADGALTDPHGSMNELRLPHVLVALGSNAPFSIGCIRMEHGKDQNEGEDNQENCSYTFHQTPPHRKITNCPV
jgi:hypothetical protein